MEVICYDSSVQSVENGNDELYNCIPLLVVNFQNAKCASVKIRWGLKTVCWGLINITVPRV
ncbi:CLUMA_CG013511, isoform A [Clunio marinus]|uniref:CLUMA_CG013511, isoform A n=1 Tax=Clunio marinus TaxID=568069 RepID=A0A1J1IMD0_9DIPT|nr:CLUMA_CG013511, isoform A [Clunio marinus]